MTTEKTIKENAVSEENRKKIPVLYTSDKYGDSRRSSMQLAKLLKNTRIEDITLDFLNSADHRYNIFSFRIDYEDLILNNLIFDNECREYEISITETNRFLFISNYHSTTKVYANKKLIFTDNETAVWHKGMLVETLNFALKSSSLPDNLDDNEMSVSGDNGDVESFFSFYGLNDFGITRIQQKGPISISSHFLLNKRGDLRGTKYGCFLDRNEKGQVLSKCLKNVDIKIISETFSLSEYEIDIASSHINILNDVFILVSDDFKTAYDAEIDSCMKHFGEEQQEWYDILNKHTNAVWQLLIAVNKDRDILWRSVLITLPSEVEVNNQKYKKIACKWYGDNKSNFVDYCNNNNIPYIAGCHYDCIDFFIGGMYAFCKKELPDIMFDYVGPANPGYMDIYGGFEDEKLTTSSDNLQRAGHPDVYIGGVYAEDTETYVSEDNAVWCDDAEGYYVDEYYYCECCGCCFHETSGAVKIKEEYYCSNCVEEL
jgi:hypothetical protein